ncbi:hypothetical protein BV898_12341 [Hypsibius exemplaris]|uniref:Uncharacterized protein n=1 Tax=Hypsibius exemplaris TaxID=2072580 RepID=A0A1W0WDV6_HYPEX|nr:hypothetical protein BV898_12341 [Hypsibius exemplaris]
MDVVLKRSRRSVRHDWNQAVRPSSTSGPVSTEHEDAIREPTNTPLLHRLSYMHSYIGMMTCICKLNQSDIKTLYTNAWATEIGIRLLHEIADLYGFLLWETTILQQLGSEDGLAPTSVTRREPTSRSSWPTGKASRRRMQRRCCRCRCRHPTLTRPRRWTWMGINQRRLPSPRSCHAQKNVSAGEDSPAFAVVDENFCGLPPRWE